MLNNNSPDVMTVRPTFFGHGIGAAGTPVVLQPAEVRWMRLSELNGPTGRHVRDNEGLELEYLGQRLEVAGQITLLCQTQAGAIDVPLSARGDYRSAVQEAVWPSPRGARSVVVLGNASDVAIEAMVTQPGHLVDTLELGPHETRTFVRELRADREADAATSGVDSMRIETAGAIGSVRATGFVELRGRHLATIRFYDPGAAQQPNLFATNLRVADVRPVMVLKNTSDGSITATPRFLPFQHDIGVPVELSPVALGPRAAVEVDLRPLVAAAADRPDLARVSVEVVNSGLPGSLVGGLTALGRTGVQPFDVPLREPGPVNQSTGSYPWRLDGDYTTMISVTNVAATPAIFVVKITYPGGSVQPATQRLAVGETVTFDMRQMRDAADGGIPATVTSGQFRWSIIQSRGETKLNGRAEIVSVANGITSSYSCPECCPWSHAGAWLNPSGLSAPVNTTSDTIVTEGFSDCFGNFQGTYAAWAESWTVVNSSITSMSTVDWGLGRANALSGGLTGVDGRWLSEYWDWDFTVEVCFREYITAIAPGQVKVRVPSSLILVPQSETYTDPPPPFYNKRRVYQIHDQFGDPMRGDIPGGLYVTETYVPNPPDVPNPPGVTCVAGSIQTAAKFAFADGTFTDDYFLGQGASNPCSSTSTQRHWVNGNGVSRFTVTWTYDGVTIAPQ